MNLSDEYPDGEGKFIFVGDNFFSSVDLVKYLEEKGHYYVGTVWSNRRVVNAIPFKDLELIGDYDCFVNKDDNIAITKWNDSTKCIFITNFSPSNVETAYVRRGEEEETIMPFVVYHYRSYMIFVDKYGKAVKKFSIQRIVQRWWVTIFFFLIDIVLENAWLIYIENNGFTKDIEKKVYT